MDMLDKLNEYLENATQEELQETYNKLSHLLCNDNTSIEERADNVIYEPVDGHPLRACEVMACAWGYHKGATEQKQIDAINFSIAFCDHVCSFEKRVECDNRKQTCTMLATFLKQAME